MAYSAPGGAYQVKGVGGLACGGHAALTVCYTGLEVSNLSFFTFSFRHVSYFSSEHGEFHQKPQSGISCLPAGRTPTLPAHYSGVVTLPKFVLTLKFLLLPTQQPSQDRL